jgi:tetratricopeptide (TPR) repeat protein
MQHPFLLSILNKGGKMDSHSEIKKIIYNNADNEEFFQHVIAQHMEETAAVALFERAKAKLQQKNLEGAISDYTTIIFCLKTYLPEAYFNRASTKYQNKDLEAAIEDFTRVIDLQPTNIKAFLNRAKPKIQKGDLDGAIEEYTAILRIEPDHIEAFLNRATIKCQKKDYDGSIIDYSHVICLQPNNIDAWYLRAHAKYDNQEFASSLNDLAHAKKLLGLAACNRELIQTELNRLDKINRLASKAQQKLNPAPSVTRSVISSDRERLLNDHQSDSQSEPSDTSQHRKK